MLNYLSEAMFSTLKNPPLAFQSFHPGERADGDGKGHWEMSHRSKTSPVSSNIEAEIVQSSNEHGWHWYK